MNSNVYKISSTPVRYPYKAYPSQIGMIDRVIKALQRSHNCMIESPTGSGKSLALLCAVLAWRENEYEKVEKDIVEFHQGTDRPVVESVYADSSPHKKKTPEKSIIDLTSDDSFADYADNERFIDLSTTPEKLPDAGVRIPLPPVENIDEDKPLTEDELRDKVWEARKRIPKIYFGTRTHKQLAQLVRELKKTHYAGVKMTILASRDQTCINEQVRSQPNRGEACRQMLNPNTNHLTGTCKYHSKWKRQFHKPYLLRGAIRRDQLRPEGAELPCSVWDIEDIVGVGQKHGFCPYFAASTTLLSDAELIFCPYNYLIDPVVRKSVGLDLKDQVIILDEAHNIEDVCRDAASFVFLRSELQEAADNYLWAAEAESYGPVKEAKFLEGVCLKLVHWLDEVAKGSMTIQSHSLRCREWQGHEFLEVLAKLGLAQDASAKIQEAVSAISSHDDTENSEHKRGPDGVPVVPSTVPVPSLKTMEKIVLLLQYFYKADSLDYRICVKEETAAERDTGPSQQRSLCAITLNIWCMNPAVSFADVGKVARSVILASGTLAPMQTFQVELGIQFQLQLEAAHVLPKERMFVASVAKGPTGRSLRVTYQNTSQWAFQDELGELIIEVCATVPYGVLCFFPSYKLLDALRERWQSTGALQRLSETKLIIVEPKTSEQLNTVMEKFYKAVKSPATFGPTCTGALFMAVCRGKVSEGLDFADDNARAVITIGIPFPNVHCLEVTHKRNYNNERVKRGSSSLNGDSWYEIQAYRALNQALGRCLRHRQDWGALILVDERFGSHDQQKYCSGLSRWIRENIQHYSDFKHARSDLNAFTQRHLGDRKNETVVSHAERRQLYSVESSTPSTSSTPRSSLSTHSEHTPIVKPTRRNRFVFRNDDDCGTVSPYFASCEEKNKQRSKFRL